MTQDVEKDALGELLQLYRRRRPDGRTVGLRVSGAMDLIPRARRFLGLSVTQFGQLLGIPSTASPGVYYYQWTTGKKSVSPTYLARLALLLLLNDALKETGMALRDIQAINYETGERTRREKRRETPAGAVSYPKRWYPPPTGRRRPQVAHTGLESEGSAGVLPRPRPNRSRDDAVALSDMGGVRNGHAPTGRKVE